MVTAVRSHAAPKGKFFDRVVTVVLENADYKDAVKQPFLEKLGKDGVLFTNFSGVTHPSQGNYLAMISGVLKAGLGDQFVDLGDKTIVDLLEAKGLTWKVYAEQYPGNCFIGIGIMSYVRRHNPFISFTGIAKNKKRCAKIVPAKEFDKDLKENQLPHYVFYIPDVNNDGHDTGVTFADTWYREKFSALVADKKLMERTILISTFDEDGGTVANQIYTSIVGGPVRDGQVISDALNHFSILKLIEDNWTLGNLGKGDLTAKPILGIWR